MISVNRMSEPAFKKMLIKKYTNSFAKKLDDVTNQDNFP